MLVLKLVLPMEKQVLYHLETTVTVSRGACVETLLQYRIIQFEQFPG